MISPTDKQPVATELSNKLAVEEINKFRQALAKQLERSKDVVLAQLVSNFVNFVIPVSYPKTL